VPTASLITVCDTFSPRIFQKCLWGVCMLAQGFCTGFKSLMAVRFLLGAAEAGLCEQSSSPFAPCRPWLTEPPPEKST
jgi:hypothetical protein